MFKIGEFSKVSQVSLRMLRYYDEQGLFKPIHSDDKTGYRYYSAQQLPELHKILSLRDMGLSVKEIKHIMLDHISLEEIQDLLTEKKHALEDQLRLEQFKLTMIEARLTYLNRDTTSAPEVIVKSVPAVTLLSVREVSPGMAQAGTFLSDVLQSLTQQGLGKEDTGMAVFYGEHVDDQALDWEVGREVSYPPARLPQLSDGRQFHLQHLATIPEMASWIHRGSFISLFEAYHRIGQWVEAHGLQLAGPSREIFLNLGSQPEAYITEVQFPVCS